LTNYVELLVLLGKLISLFKPKACSQGRFGRKVAVSQGLISIKQSGY
jgi:hypothetical protein